MYWDTLSAQHVAGFWVALTLTVSLWPDLDLRIKAPEPGERHLFSQRAKPGHGGKDRGAHDGLSTCLRVEQIPLPTQDCLLVSKLECGLLI